MDIDSFNCCKLDVYSVVFVESPLQALNACEYILYKSISTDIVFIINLSTLDPDINERNLKQIVNTIQFFGFKYYDVTNIMSYRKSLFHNRSLVKKLLRELRQRASQAIIGEYRSKLAHTLTSVIDNVVYVDDGSATLRMDRIRDSSIKLSERFYRFIYELLYFPFRLISYKPATFFSVYQIKTKLLPDDKLIANHYLSLKQQIAHLNVCKAIYVIGQPLQFAGVVKDDIALTFQMLQSVANEKKCAFEKIKYITHRREPSSKIDAIRNFGCEVISLECPFELYPLLYQQRIQNLCGFYSTLFETMPAIYADVYIDSYEIPEHLLSDEQRPFVKSVYASYRAASKANITVRTLPI